MAPEESMRRKKEREGAGEGEAAKAARREFQAKVVGWGIWANSLRA